MFVVLTSGEISDQKLRKFYCRRDLERNCFRRFVTLYHSYLTETDKFTHLREGDSSQSGYLIMRQVKFHYVGCFSS